MDPVPRTRRLRKVADILKDLETLESSSSSLPSSDPETQQPKSTKKPEKKTTAPRLKTFNKLIDINPSEDYSIEEFEYLRDQPLDLDSVKPSKKQLSQKVFKEDSNKASYSLAKSVLTNKSEHDNLIVSNPVKVSGFISKNLSQNSREVFREGLKNQINSRKTTHLNSEGIFDKPSTDFEKKTQIISDLSISSAKSNSSFEEKSKNSCNKAVLTCASSEKSLQINVKKNNCVLIDLEAEKSGEDHSSDTEEELHEGFLKEIIDDEEQPEDNNYTKHVKDMLEKEEKEIKMVVNAEFKKKMNEKIVFRTQEIVKEETRQNKFEFLKGKVFSQTDDDKDDEDLSLIALKKTRAMRNLEKSSGSSLILDEKSNDFLKLIQQPKHTPTVKSLLNSKASLTQSKPVRAYFIKKK